MDRNQVPDGIRLAPALRKDDEDQAPDSVEEASRESFPASDAPGWISEGIGREEDNEDEEGEAENEGEKHGKK